MSNIPNFPINPGDLLLVGDLLKPYAEVLQKTTPPSQAQRLLLQRITDLIFPCMQKSAKRSLREERF